MRSWKKIHLLPVIIIVIGIASTLLSSEVAYNFKEFLGLLIPVVLASLLVGVILGFLFGIPKLNDKYNPSDDYQQNLKYKPNTNLEDISDWLTKIIVGVSLTQALKIPRYLDNLSLFILKDSECATDCNYAQAIVIADIIFFVISGFIIGYFYTRLYLPGLFSVMEELKQQSAEIKIWKEGYNRTSVPNDLSFSLDNMARNTNSDFNFLTDFEMSLLDEISKANNHFVIKRSLSSEEIAALKVLIDKSILRIIGGGILKTGAVLTIVDEKLYHDLKKKNDSLEVSD